MTSSDYVPAAYHCVNAYVSRNDLLPGFGVGYLSWQHATTGRNWAEIGPMAIHIWPIKHYPCERTNPRVGDLSTFLEHWFSSDRCSYYCRSGVSMVVADGLVPVCCQDICNQTMAWADRCILGGLQDNQYLVSLSTIITLCVTWQAPPSLCCVEVSLQSTQLENSIDLIALR